MRFKKGDYVTSIFDVYTDVCGFIDSYDKSTKKYVVKFLQYKRSTKSLIYTTYDFKEDELRPIIVDPTKIYPQKPSKKIKLKYQIYNKINYHYKLD